MGMTGAQADIAALASASDSLCAVRSGLPAGGVGVWFVGGAVRDLLLGIEVDDVDLAIDGDSRKAARALHEVLGGDILSLSDRILVLYEGRIVGEYGRDVSEEELGIAMTGGRGEEVA